MQNDDNDTSSPFVNYPAGDWRNRRQRRIDAAKARKEGTRYVMDIETHPGPVIRRITKNG